MEATQQITLYSADDLWMLIRAQAKSVQKEVAKRFKALDKAEREHRKWKAYEATLTPEQIAAAHDIAGSISRALKEVKEAEANGIEMQCLDDFLEEVKAESVESTAV